MNRCVCVCVPSAGWSSRCGWSVPVWIPAGSEPGGRSAEGLRSERGARSPRTRSSTWGYLREGDSVCVLHSSYKALFTCTTCVCVCVCIPRVRDLCVEQNTMATVSAGLNPEPDLHTQTGSRSSSVAL